MGYKEFEIKVPLKATEQELKTIIGKTSKTKAFEYFVQRKSLDARNKRNIHWVYRVGVASGQIKEGTKPKYETVEIPKRDYSQTAIVVGSGPAGIFSALTLASAGVKVVLLEQGGDVALRKKSILQFESSQSLDPKNNYGIGEGGAGTFSDGKLTSRTKGISRERNFIFDHLIKAGAPEEISYLTHPHVGSDNLYIITKNLRNKLLDLGGEIFFDTKVVDLCVKNGKVEKVNTSKGQFEAHHFVFAPGHSSYETYKMLINQGVGFKTKNFAIGMRAEHSQTTINHAQWGQARLPGVKAAEYRLTASGTGGRPMYSFCMCPGGVIVPATPYSHTNIVNGMSLYNRGNKWANAAVVVGVHPDELLRKEAGPIAALEYLETLESRFFDYSGSYAAPAISIKGLLGNGISGAPIKSSYPFRLVPADIGELLPKLIYDELKIGLSLFCKKLKGYDQGSLIGLESKTSSPVQVLRDREKYTCSFNNLYVVGEGSGWAGGIISSAADGVKAALALLKTAK